MVGHHARHRRNPCQRFVERASDRVRAGGRRRLGLVGVQPLCAVVAGDEDSRHADQSPRIKGHPAGDDRDDRQPLDEGLQRAIGPVHQSGHERIEDNLRKRAVEVGQQARRLG
jgi:hypothetical protein